MTLTGTVIGKLTTALCDAYPNPTDLEYFVRVNLDESLERLAGPGNLHHRIFTVIERLDAAGPERMRRLVLAMRRERASNPLVREVLDLRDFRPWVCALPAPETVRERLELLRQYEVPTKDVCDTHAVVAEVPQRFETIDNAVWDLAEAPARAGVPILVRFAHRLAVRDGVSSARQPLHDWRERYVDKYGLSRSQRSEIEEDRKRVESMSDGRLCLLVVLHDDEGDTYRCDAWVGPESASIPGEIVRVCDPIDGVRPECLSAVIDGLLRVPMVDGRLKKSAAPLLVEVVLPVSAMLAAAEGLASESTAVWNEHDVVMRWRDRVYANVRETPSIRPAQWERRWRGRADPKSRWISFDDPQTPGNQRARHFSASASVGLALSFHPETCPSEQRLEVLEEALRHGLPIVAWIADGAPRGVDPRASFQEFLARSEVPGSALEAFSAARQEWDPSKEDCSRHMVLIWDDPDRLPPDAYENDLAPPDFYYDPTR